MLSPPVDRGIRTVLHTEPADTRELQGMLRRLPDIPEDLGIAVDALVVDSGLRWLLQRRGTACRDEIGMLEGPGGAVDGGETFREALSREIHEEAGDEIEVEIVRFLEGRLVAPDGLASDSRLWLVMSYLCFLRRGKPQVTEPTKNAGFVFLPPDAVNPSELSRSARASWTWLRNERQSLAVLRGRLIAG
jgi:8-oxo-dGTP pyrophosphatase MutT (NUDIX family)